MDQRICQEEEQHELDCKCEKVFPSVERPTLPIPLAKKSGNFKDQNLKFQIDCQTPEKSNEPLQRESKGGQIELKEKYKSIAELFDCMNCSLRLLNLCKKLPTFQNVRSQVEVLIKREFSYRNLAQIKYIIPEAVKIDKVLLHDKKTLCMKPDLTISLQFDVVEGHCEQSDFMALTQVFGSRLVNFITMQPEDCEVPEALLPEPFGQTNQISLPEQWQAAPTVESQPNFEEIKLTSTDFSPYSSISRQFSQKAVFTTTEKTDVITSPINISSSVTGSLSNQDMQNGQNTFSGSTKEDLDTGKQRESCDGHAKFTVMNPVFQLNSPQLSAGSSYSESPLVKPGTSRDNLMIETPVQLTPRRSMCSSEVKLESVSEYKSTLSCKPAKRVLDFSGLNGDGGTSNSSEEEPRCYGKAEEKLSNLDDYFMKTQAGGEPWQYSSSCLPDMVAAISNIFKSVNSFSITKEELIHKIIIESLDINERREVEDQIDLLEKLVPDWISQCLTSSGDITYSIKKSLTLESVQARIRAAEISS